MNNVVEIGDFSLRTRYIPRARYHAIGDYVEYLREDKPYIMRRIDGFLTVALDVETRKPAGFRLKGFKNFFLKHLQSRQKVLEDQFLALVSAIEIAATNAGNHVFASSGEVKEAYASAHKIASEDRVRLEPAAWAA